MEPEDTGKRGKGNAECGESFCSAYDPGLWPCSATYVEERFGTHLPVWVY